MNSLHNTIKQFRLLNLNTALKTISECKPTVPNIVKVKNDLVCNPKILSFAPRSVGVEIIDKRKPNGITRDPIPYIPIVNPRSILPLLDKEWRKDEIGLPAIRQEEMHAVRLIVIRRKKMKKHQRRKLWKKMRYTWARIKQHRRQTKEKNFQNALLAMVKEANEFQAEKYVADKIHKANHTPLPTRWRHKRLPEFIIRQLLGIDKKINYKHTDVYKA
uniref:Ribosomal protein mS38 C-terminal domain-containing protein n=1 Tax=Heliothis virescens TaxID=7102 RepID=A0A2A4JHD1_HELVI